MKPINIINNLKEGSSINKEEEYGFLVRNGSSEKAARAMVEYASKIEEKYKVALISPDMYAKPDGYQNGTMYVYLDRSKGNEIYVYFHDNGKKCIISYDGYISNKFLECFNYLNSILPIDLN